MTIRCRQEKIVGVTNLFSGLDASGAGIFDQHYALHSGISRIVAVLGAQINAASVPAAFTTITADRGGT